MNFIGEFFSHWERVVLAVTFITASYFFLKYAKGVFVKGIIEPLKEGFDNYWGAIKGVIAQDRSLEYKILKDDLDALITQTHAFNEKWTNNKEGVAAIMGGLILNDSRRFKDQIVMKVGQFRVESAVLSQLGSYVATSFSHGFISDNILKDFDKLNDPYQTTEASKTVPVQVIQVESPNYQPYQNPQYATQTVGQTPGWTVGGESKQSIQGRIQNSPQTTKWQILLFTQNTVTGIYDVFLRPEYISKTQALQLLNANTGIFNGVKYGFNFTGNSLPS